MPTIGQLPSLSSVDPADEIPLSHVGVTQSISVGTPLSGTQPAILVPTGTLLGRVSLGPGGPELIGVGLGLGLQAGVLEATGADHAGFPSRAVLETTDRVVLSSGGAPKLLELSFLRGLFSAGSDIAIDSAGTISATIGAASRDASGSSYSVASLPAVTTIASSDLVGISQGGAASSITYQNFLSGLTIGETQPAVAASDTDTTWVAQGSDTMVCQTFGAIWAWIVSNQLSYKYPVVEITTNTTLDKTVHNGRVLVCSQPVTLTPVFANMGSGFACSVINLSGTVVSFGAGIVSSSGASILPAGVSCTMQGVTYSGGSVIYASISGGLTSGTVTVPGAVIGLVIAAVSSDAVAVAWVPPASGGAVTNYTVQYLAGGSTVWVTASSSVVGTGYSISNLQASTTYDFVVFATNPAGTGPSSSIVTAITTTSACVVPGQVTGLTVGSPTSSSLALTWSEPSVGTAPISFTINYRTTGLAPWSTYASNVSSTSVTVTGLSASAGYDFEVFASNTVGTGTPSVVVSQSTAVTGTSLTAVTWNVAPSGSFAHGRGSIGVNAQITPSSAPVQFGFSTSLTVPPGNWTQGTYVNTNLWGAYVSTPATAGTWYAWVEGVDGSLPTIYATPFAVT